MNIFYEKYARVLQVRKNWESDIASIRVEACGCDEDPLGYRAVFFNEEKRSFAIGASLLQQREENLNKSGYKAPMTHRAIELIESKIGTRLQTAA